MGEYVGRIYDEVRRRPKYIVESTVGLPADHMLGPARRP